MAPQRRRRRSPVGGGIAARIPATIARHRRHAVTELLALAPATVASTLSALYPAVIARFAVHEQMSRVQLGGLGAVVMIGWSPG